MRVQIMSWEELDRRAGVNPGPAIPASGPRKKTGDTVRMRNVTPTVWLTDPVRLPMMGRMWTARVDFQAGLRAFDLYERLRAMGEEGSPSMEEYREALADAVALCGPLLRPEDPSLVERVAMALGVRKNPLRRASERDIVEVLAFFLMLRAMPSAGS